MSSFSNLRKHIYVYICTYLYVHICAENDNIWNIWDVCFILLQVSWQRNPGLFPSNSTAWHPNLTHFCLQRYLTTIFGKMAVAETGIEMWHQKVFNLHFNLLTTVGRTSAIKPLSTNIIPSKYLLRWYLTSPSTNNSLSHGSFHRWSLHQISVDSRL